MKRMEEQEAKEAEAKKSASEGDAATNDEEKQSGEQKTNDTTANTSSGSPSTSSSSFLASHPLFFRLQLSSLLSELEELKENGDREYTRLKEELTKFTQATEQLEQATTKQKEVEREYRAAKNAYMLAHDLREAKRKKLESMSRARDVLNKHKIVWKILDGIREKDEMERARAAAAAAMENDEGDGSSAASSFLQGVGVAGGSGTGVSSVYGSSSSSNKDMLDAERHALLLCSNSPGDVQREIRSHMLRVYASFLRVRLEVAMATLEQTRERLRARSGLDADTRDIQLLKQQLTTQQKEHVQLNEQYEMIKMKREWCRQRNRERERERQMMEDAQMQEIPAFRLHLELPRTKKVSTKRRAQDAVEDFNDGSHRAARNSTSTSRKRSALPSAATSSSSTAEGFMPDPCVARPNGVYRERLSDEHITLLTQETANPAAHSRSDGAPQDGHTGRSADASVPSSTHSAPRLLLTHRIRPLHTEPVDDTQEAEEILASLWDG